ncbi:ankyrin repeat-containing domain protein [Phycomyces nitens]|nr:ankyrin repeat-containing domain protein [Phycomyces nitens]
MPSVFARTFAALNVSKPPTIADDVILPVVDIKVAEFEDANSDDSNSESDEPVLRCITNTQHISTPELSPKPSISIFKAAEEGDVAALAYYIEHASPNPANLLNTRDPETDCTLLHLVVSHVSNPLTALRLLLSNGADVSARNVYNVQAIHMLLLNCRSPLSSLTVLLEHKANPNARDGDGWTPLHYCARFCDPSLPILQALVERGGNINAVDASQKSPVFGLLAHGDHAETLDWMIHQAKADLTIKGDFLDPKSRKTNKGSIVMQAAKYGRLDCLMMLIHSPASMQMLRSILDRQELTYCIQLVQDQIHSRDSSVKHGRLETVMETLQSLLHSLECDPDSTIKPPQSLLFADNETKKPRKQKAFLKRMSNIFKPKK